MTNKFLNFDADDSISKYFKEVRKSVLLTHEEELELAKKIKDGDQKSIDKLVKANLKFVITIAKNYQNQGLPLSDLINEGNLGLVKAANKFNHEKRCRFITYAVWWIKQSIIYSLNENARMVRLPTKVIQKLSTLKKEISRFESLNEREPSNDELSESSDELMNLLNSSKCASLNEPINEDGDEFIDMISNDDNIDDKIEIDNRLKNELNNTLSILEDRERDIIECYFGINRETEPMTLEAIGSKYSLSKERVRQIKFKSLRKLRSNSSQLHRLIS